MKRKSLIPFDSDMFPVFASADVIVCGGGPAGVAAALSSARTGASVVLLEQTVCCGGMSTLGLVPAMIHFSDRKNMVSSGIPLEIAEAMCKRMGLARVQPIWQNIDPEVLKRVCDEKLAEAGVSVFFGIRVADVCMDGAKIRSVLVSAPDGLQQVAGKVFIDATGDGMIAYLAGNTYEAGDENGEVMGPTLCAQYGGIDRARLANVSARTGHSVYELWEQHKAEFGLEWESHFVGLFSYGTATGSGNLGHIYGTDPLDPASYSRACSEGRKIADAIHRFYKKYVPGCENSDLVSTADLLGVRESRRIQGDYVLNVDDYMAKRHFADEIGCFFYPIDIHSSKKVADAWKNVEAKMRQTSQLYEPGENYGIPYRALIASDLENVLTAGRCISTDRQVLSSIRVMPCCMITGAAAGAAAAMAKDTGNVRAVDTQKLRSILRGQGAWLPDTL